MFPSACHVTIAREGALYVAKSTSNRAIRYIPFHLLVYSRGSRDSNFTALDWLQTNRIIRRGPSTRMAQRRPPSRPPSGTRPLQLRVPEVSPSRAPTRLGARAPVERTENVGAGRCRVKRCPRETMKGRFQRKTFQLPVLRGEEAAAG